MDEDETDFSPSTPPRVTTFSLVDPITPLRDTISCLVVPDTPPHVLLEREKEFDDHNFLPSNFVVKKVSRKLAMKKDRVYNPTFGFQTPVFMDILRIWFPICFGEKGYGEREKKDEKISVSGSKSSSPNAPSASS
ncbi:unnamed protein product [Cuscuta epithymum]|uniref:Uncharacterized protein n=1 Tax=Cuscuta epithymum TaxID=186058 RepID=A0AAV0CRD7_9ASTE|nr:unnamed protein product [Cuscuta epithymum]CAH9090461.1 unnamed protein product [Cuscuta epithymum]CAH9130378.1 unnamed protein product [Cuscuta epithymum]